MNDTGRKEKHLNWSIFQKGVTMALTKFRSCYLPIIGLNCIHPHHFPRPLDQSENHKIFVLFSIFIWGSETVPLCAWNTSTAKDIPQKGDGKLRVKLDK